MDTINTSANNLALFPSHIEQRENSPDNNIIESLQTEEKKRIVRFLLNYCFKDSKEVYTNGSILVPMFRVLDALRQDGQEYKECC